MTTSNGTADEPVEGTIEAINDRGIKVAGEWRNVSKFHPVDLPDRGARVRILLDTKGFIRTLQVLDAAPSSTSTSSPNRDREIRRMCAIKVAASVIGQFAQTREEVRTEHIFPLAEHPRLARTGAAGVTTDDIVERIRKLTRLADSRPDVGVAPRPNSSSRGSVSTAAAPLCFASCSARLMACCAPALDPHQTLAAGAFIDRLPQSVQMRIESLPG
jgi:hypothetical protein